MWLITREVLASQIPLAPGVELDAQFCLGTPFSETRPWRVNYLSWQKTQGKEQEETLKDESLCSYMTAKIILWGWMSSGPSQSCSFRKSNPSLWVAVPWMRELQLFPWWSPGCRSGRILLYPLFIALFFSLVLATTPELDEFSNDASRRIMPGLQLLQKTAGLHLLPLGWWYWGNPDLLIFQCYSSVGQSSEVTALEPLLWPLEFTECIWSALMWRIWHITPAGVDGISPSLDLAFWLSKIGCKMRDPCQL